DAATPPEITESHYASWSAALRDAVGFARSEGTTRSIAVMGFSLGAFLSVSEAATDDRVAAVVSHAGGLSQYFPAGVRRMPPVLIVQAKDDPITPVAEARKLQRFLK